MKTTRSPLYAEFWRHCVLSGGNQRRALPRHQSEEIKIFNTYISNGASAPRLTICTLYYLFFYPQLISKIILYKIMKHTIYFQRSTLKFLNFINLCFVPVFIYVQNLIST